MVDPAAVKVDSATQGVRLQKALADAGIASRRAAEGLILAGRVQLNGQVVTLLGTRVDPLRDEVRLDGERVALGHPAAFHYVLLHKPEGVVTTARDPEGRPTVLDLVPTPYRLYPVGRLDRDSQGLVLLTDDGELAYRLMRASSRVEKWYEALVTGYVTPRQVRMLVSGVVLSDGPAWAVRTEILGTEAEGTWVRVVLHEGRKREVRRMLAAVGCSVLRLVRVRLGPLALGSLPVGASRPLRAEEVAGLQEAVGLPAASDPAIRRFAEQSTGVQRPRGGEARRPLNASR